MKKYLPLVEYHARTYANSRVPFADLVQEGLCGVLEAEKRFDPLRGTQFSTYAVFWIKKRTSEAVQGEVKTSLRAVSLEERPEIGGEDVDPEERWHAYNRLPDIELPFRFPETEEKILRLFFVQGKTLGEISKMMGLTRERIRQLKYKALRRAKMTHSLHPIGGNQ